MPTNKNTCYIINLGRGGVRADQKISFDLQPEHYEALAHRTAELLTRQIETFASETRENFAKSFEINSDVLEIVRGGVGAVFYCAEQREIGLQLENLGARVWPTSDQSGPDICATLPPVAGFPKAEFQVQSKSLLNDNLRLRINHLRDSADLPTVPIWWDAKERKAYWAACTRN